jgi:hypothetical protein
MMNKDFRYIWKPRRFVYWIGLRPKPGSIWYSPSLTLHYTGIQHVWLRSGDDDA